MSKQTAVNQIFAQIKAARKDTKFWNDSMLVDWLLEQEERYKQMEKEQMIDAILDNRNITSQVTLKDAEKYYNETYGETKN
jgi:predicted nucleic-acid-binding protein